MYTGFEPPEAAFTHVMEPLRSADLRFAQTERMYSERGAFQEQAGSKHGRQHPHAARAFQCVPFDVVSLASNHTGDWGPQAVTDTLDTFRVLGIPTIGAGHDIAEARAPVILTCNGLRIAFLAYVSVTLPQFWATESRAGSAPLRAHTFYEAYEFQPGAPARVVTVPHAGDLEHMVEDVKKAKAAADLVLVSLHWGVHYLARPCDYQPIIAHAAIDAGATAILGHHPPHPQGIERYRDAIIFYSLGNFAFYMRGENDPARKSKLTYCSPNDEYTQKEVYTIEPDPGYVFDYKRHTRESGIAFFEMDAGGLKRVTYRPVFLNEIGQPVPLRAHESQFEESLTYLNWAGKFIAGGLTHMRAVGDCYEVFARDAA